MNQKNPSSGPVLPHENHYYFKVKLQTKIIFPGTTREKIC